HRSRKEAQPHRNLRRLRMARDVVQRFLHDAIQMDGDAAIQWPAGPRLFTVYRDARLLLKTGKVLIHGALESDLVENHGMERVGKAANLFERDLYDALNLAQVGAQ